MFKHTNKHNPTNFKTSIKKLKNKNKQQKTNKNKNTQ